MSKGLNFLLLSLLSWAIILAVALPVFANDGPCSEQLPPSQYMNGNVEYQIVTVSSQSELSSLCGYNRVLACAMRDQPLIYMISDNFIADLAGDYHKGRRWKQCLITHEVAHINGWRH